MSILIKGMEIPKSNNNFERVEKILISSSGLVEWVDDNNTLLDEFYAVELPPHGRLIDADAIEYTDCEHGVLYDIANAPTIIEAEIEE